MSKFDIILLFVAALIVTAMLLDFWLVINGMPQFDAGVWTLITAVSTGEVVTFSVYRIIKNKGESLPKTLLGKHSAIQEMEDEDEHKTIKS